MSSEGIIAVSAAVTALTQLAKWAGLRDSWGPLAVILLSGAGVSVWLISGSSWPPARTDVWPIFSGWIAVTLASAGVFGFTRAGASAVTSITQPPNSGAGSSPTVKSDDDRQTGRPFVRHGEGGHAALLATVPLRAGDMLNVEDARHLDGRRIAPNEIVSCDTCGAKLTHVVGGATGWVAESRAD